MWSKSWSDERGCWVYAVEGEPKTWNIQYLGVLNDGALLGVKINGEENDSLFSEIKEGDTLNISDREFSNLAFLKVVSASHNYITAMGVDIVGQMITFVMYYNGKNISARLKQIG